MFGKKRDLGEMTDAQRDQLLVYAVGGATDGPVYWLARQRLESVRWAVENGRMSEGEVQRDR